MAAPPPPPAETTAAGEPGRERFRTVVAVLIALTSILSAVVAWRASASSSAASDLDERALQELVIVEQERAAISGLVANDQRLFARYQQHILAWRFLQDRAEERRRNNPELADALAARSAGELSLARSLLRYFQGYAPDFGDEEGRVEHDPEYLRTFLEDNSEELQTLNPAAVAADAEEEHGRAVSLVGVFTLVVAALFFLTIAQFARPSVRGVFAVSGAAVGVVGLSLFLLVEFRVL